MRKILLVFISFTFFACTASNKTMATKKGDLLLDSIIATALYNNKENYGYAVNNYIEPTGEKNKNRDIMKLYLGEVKEDSKTEIESDTKSFTSFEEDGTVNVKTVTTSKSKMKKKSFSYGLGF